MSERKLQAWLEAGVIDPDTAGRIRAWEAERSRPLALWAVVGIGALAIGLGVISVVAANWQEVPGVVRLAVHLALLIALAGFIAWRGEGLEHDHPWGLEAALFVLAMLGMAFFGHIGQVYQTSSPLWQPLAVWLLLFAPLLLLRGQGWLTAALLFVVLAYCVWDYAGGLEPQPLDTRDPDSILVARIVLITAAPLLLAPLAAWMRGRSTREAFWKRLEQLALAYAVGGASLVVIAGGLDRFEGGILGLGAQGERAGLALAAGGAIAWARRGRSGEATGAVMAGAGLACIIAYLFSGSQTGGGMVFMALWIGIAAAALYAGWRGVFQLAVAAVALRLIVLSFELASDLLTSGFGLILAGLMILGIAFVAVRISRAFAPPKEVTP
ncbi:MAG: DUF2157 domain-containing protein [Novosphingobium sp.]